MEACSQKTIECCWEKLKKTRIRNGKKKKDTQSNQQIQFKQDKTKSFETHMELLNAEMILGKIKVREVTLSYFKLYYKATATKMVRYWQKTDAKTKGTEKGIHKYVSV